MPARPEGVSAQTKGTHIVPVSRPNFLRLISRDVGAHGFMFVVHKKNPFSPMLYGIAYYHTIQCGNVNKLSRTGEK